MPGECIEVAAKSLYVNILMHDTLCPVNYQQRAGCVYHRSDFLHGVDKSEHVGCVADADDSRTLAKQSGQQVKAQGAAVADRQHAEFSPFAGTEHLPGHDVGVVLGLGDDDLVAFLYKCFSKAPGGKVQRMGSAGGEDDFLTGRGADKVLYGITSGLVGVGRLDRHSVDGPVEVGRAFGRYSVPAAYDTPRTQGSSCIVQIHKRLSIDRAGKLREIVSIVVH